MVDELLDTRRAAYCARRRDPERSMIVGGIMRATVTRHGIAFRVVYAWWRRGGVIHLGRLHVSEFGE